MPLTVFYAPEDFDAERFVLDCRGKKLDCRPGGPVQVMGILNVTPDSFSDGGQFLEKDAALRRAEEMLEAGAAIIDVGGESTRPGAETVTADEERRRVLPIVEALAERFPGALLSVDTYKPEVARAALDAGAHLINDVTGQRHGAQTADVCARYEAPLVVMHSVGMPGALTRPRAYDDVVGDVKASLAYAVSTAEDAGVRHVITDPGFGFGKTAEENLSLIAHLDAFLALGRPVMVGLSRKSTIGAVLGTPDAPAPVGERLYGTLGATAVAVMHGATLVRTHDVRETVEMLDILTATLRAGA